MKDPGRAKERAPGVVRHEVGYVEWTRYAEPVKSVT
jgi:hypothetical protein